MLRVALTGGIATGKNHVRMRIAARGIPTIDADGIVHQLFTPGSAITAEIARRFGASVLRDDGSVDRRILGSLVFADPSARRDLEAIVHPLVYEWIADWSAMQGRAGVPWVLADIPLLFETRREHDFDRVIVTACAPDEQVRRMMWRDGDSETAALAKLAAQWPIANKVRRATDVIDTGGTFADTDQQVDAICERIDAVSRGQ
jgi:dephospho-CoA kinase